jgi:hypothetical protein
MLALVWFARRTKYRLFEANGRVKAPIPVEPAGTLEPAVAVEDRRS